MEYVNSYLFNLPYVFHPSIRTSKDGVTGLTNDTFSDTGIMLNSNLDSDVVNFLIEKFADKNKVVINEILRSRANLTFKSTDNRPERVVFIIKSKHFIKRMLDCFTPLFIVKKCRFCC